MAFNVPGSIWKPNRAANRAAQHPQVVFGKALLGTSNGTDQARANVVHTVDEIQDVVLQGIVEQAVDREVTATCVVFSIAESNLIGMPTVGIVAILAERCNFDLADRASTENRYHSERLSDRQRAILTKQLANLFGASTGCDVVVVRWVSHDLVANTSPCEQCLIARGLQFADDLDREFTGCWFWHEPQAYRNITSLSQHQTTPPSGFGKTKTNLSVQQFDELVVFEVRVAAGLDRFADLDDDTSGFGKRFCSRPRLESAVDSNGNKRHVAAFGDRGNARLKEGDSPVKTPRSLREQDH